MYFHKFSLIKKKLLIPQYLLKTHLLVAKFKLLANNSFIEIIKF